MQALPLIQAPILLFFLDGHSLHSDPTHTPASVTMHVLVPLMECGSLW